MKKDNVIVCPKCGYQYTPAEIYIPSCFFGKPSFIKRDVNGVIEEVIGKHPDLTELYVCDNCKTSFKVTAKIDYETNIDVLSDFEHDYETRIK